MDKAVIGGRSYELKGVTYSSSEVQRKVVELQRCSHKKCGGKKGSVRSCLCPFLQTNVRMVENYNIR